MKTENITQDSSRITRNSEKLYSLIKERLENHPHKIHKYADLPSRDAAVLIPLFFKEDHAHVLFTKRTDNVEHHKGQISFPGGMRDPEDNNLLDTALRETWEEMGIQYGQRCGKDIARNFDLNWEKLILKGEKSFWQRNRTEKERAHYGIAYLQRSFKELSYLRPELIQMFAGIAEGAAGAAKLGAAAVADAAATTMAQEALLDDEDE